jgi:hypothetical protein
MNNGYFEVHAPDHPASRPSGWIYSHRLVASEIIGRPLLPEECVHHVDENKTNNSHSNLWVFATVADHARFHSNGIATQRTDGVYVSPKVEKEMKNRCGNCSNPCHKKFCSHLCACASRRVPRPSKDALADLILRFPMTRIGSMFSVSDNAVRRWAVSYGIMPGR